MEKFRVAVPSSLGLVFVLPAGAQMLGGVPYTLALGNTAPGSEWSPTAITVNRFKYPGDVRLPAASYTFWTTAHIRHVSGNKLLYISDMYGGALGIYRFNLETAVGSGRLSQSFCRLSFLG